MRTPLSASLFQYWTELRAGRPMPLRTQIDPASLASILPDLFILEAEADGDHRLRLAGTRVCTLFGRELRGTPFSRLWRRDQHRQTARTARRVLEEARPMSLAAAATTLHDDRLRFDIPLFPLADPDGQPTRLLGAMDMIGLQMSEAALPISVLEQTGLSVIVPPPAPAPEDEKDRSADHDWRWKGAARRLGPLGILDGGLS